MAEIIGALMSMNPWGCSGTVDRPGSCILLIRSMLLPVMKQVNNCDLQAILRLESCVAYVPKFTVTSTTRSSTTQSKHTALDSIQPYPASSRLVSTFYVYSNKILYKGTQHRLHPCHGSNRGHSQGPQGEGGQQCNKHLARLAQASANERCCTNRVQWQSRAVTFKGTCWEMPLIYRLPMR